jgi:hypothetical protein
MASMMMMMTMVMTMVISCVVVVWPRCGARALPTVGASSLNRIKALLV